MKEEFIPIGGFEDRYKISNLGRVKSLKYNKNLKPAKDRKGYLHVILCSNGLQKLKKIHRLVGENFIENINNKPHINHKDGNKLNNHISNLEWCTPLENMRHAYKTGIRKNTSNGHTKLNEYQVRVIRWLRKINPQRTYAEIGKIFRVNDNTICDIVNYKKWKNI